MKSEFESRETFECIFGGEDGIDLSKDETGEYSFQPTRFAYSFFLVAWQYRQTEVDELQKQRDSFIKAHEIEVDENVELQKRLDAALKLIPSLKSENDLWGCEQVERQIELLEQALKGGSDE